MRRAITSVAVWIGLVTTIVAVTVSLSYHSRPTATHDQIETEPVHQVYSVGVQDPASSASAVDSVSPSQTMSVQTVGREFKSSELTIYGIVSDVGGDPISGVVVGHGNFSTAVKTDAGGHYRLSLDLNTRSMIVVRYLRSGYAEETRAILSKDYPTGELALPMVLQLAGDTVAVSGRVLDESGTGVPSQTVRIISRQLGGRQYVTFSQPDGTYEFEGVRRGKYDFTVLSEGPYKRYNRYGLEIESVITGLSVELDSVRLGVLVGDAVDSEGTPLSFFSFRAHSSATPNRPHQVKTDAFGRFEINQAAAGLWIMAARNNGYFRLSNVLFDNFAPTNVRLVFDIGPFELSGWVLDRSSNPIADASVELTRADRYSDVKRTSRRVVTADYDGRFRIPRLALGDYRITVAANGYEPTNMNYHVGHRSDQPYFVLAKN